MDMTGNDTGILLRPLRSDEYDAVRDLWLAAGLDVRLTGRDARDEFVRQLQQFPTLFLGAETEGNLVGLVLGTHDFRRGWINRLAVHPDYQRRGVARRLVGACERALRDCGIEIICALIEEGNEASFGAFASYGYADFKPAHYYRKKFREDI